MHRAYQGGHPAARQEQARADREGSRGETSDRDGAQANGHSFEWSNLTSVDHCDGAQVATFDHSEKS